ncbi:hypothetical protein D3C85_1062810 [compost metagenome]
MRAHGHVGIAQGTGRFAERRIDTQFTPAALVHGNRIEGGGYADFRPPLHQLFGKAQARRTGVDAAIDVRLGDIDQTARTLQIGHAQDNLHGHLRRLAMPSIEQRAIVFGEFDRGAGDGVGHRIVERLPGIVGQPFEQAQRCIFNPREGMSAQVGKGLRADAEHRQGAFENGLRHEHAQGQDLVGFGQHQCRRCMAVADQFHQHAAAGARAAPAGNRQHAPGDALAAQWMMTVDDFAT